jgi:thymidylate kinase
MSKEKVKYTKYFKQGFSMFLIVEGVHNTGKSTLVKSLSNFNEFSCRRMFPELLSSRNNQVSDFALGTNMTIAWFADLCSDSLDIIFDRCHVSEYAYSRAIRSINDEIASNAFLTVDARLAQCDVKMVYLTCSYDTIVARLKDKNKVYNEEDYNKLNDYFNIAISKTLIPTIILNTDILKEQYVLEAVEQFICGGVNDEFEC